MTSCVATKGDKVLFNVQYFNVLLGHFKTGCRYCFPCPTRPSLLQLPLCMRQGQRTVWHGFFSRRARLGRRNPSDPGHLARQKWSKLSAPRQAKESYLFDPEALWQCRLSSTFWECFPERVWCSGSSSSPSGIFPGLSQRRPAAK